MNKVLKFSCFLSVFHIFFLSFSANATHIVGGSINYSHISGNTYEISTTLYRDCSSVPAPSTIIIDATSSCGSQSLQLEGVDMDTTVYCSSLLNFCNGGTLPGISWVYYVDTAELTPCADWTFTYELCCRAFSLNVLNSITEGFYIESTLDNSNQENSSPIFNQSLNLVAEVNQPFCVNNNAFDLDGDSLVYTLLNPIGLNGNNVTYEPGFTVSNPTGAGSNFIFNQFSGNICFTPNLIGNFVISVRVDEYRNNVIIGSTIRDFQISTVNGVSLANQDISGTVTDGNGNPVSGVNIELFEYGISQGNLNLTATQVTNSLGEFVFSGQNVGQYLVRSQPSSGYIPTYHESTAYWQYAQMVYLICDAQVTTDITLVDINNPIGTGVIAGYLNGTGVVKSGDPLEDVSILLFDKNTNALVQHSITSSSGFYELDNIPSGSYYIIVDLEGLCMISTHFIDLQVGEIIQNANFFADENGVSTTGDYETQGFASLETISSELNFSLHPNPGDNELFINHKSKDSFEVTMYNSLGKIVLECSSSKNSLKFSTKNLPNGIYYVVVSSMNSSQRLKWIKK